MSANLNVNFLYYDETMKQIILAENGRRTEVKKKVCCY